MFGHAKFQSEANLTGSALSIEGKSRIHKFCSILYQHLSGVRQRVFSAGFYVSSYGFTGTMLMADENISRAYFNSSVMYGIFIRCPYTQILAMHLTN